MLTSKEWARLALADPDENGTCLHCNNPMQLDPGSEPSALCHPCAQEALVVVATALYERNQLETRVSEEQKPDPVRARYKQWLTTLPTEQLQQLHKARSEHNFAGTYTVTVTPELYAELFFVKLLNKRMIDRGPEHVEINTLLTKLVATCLKQADDTWGANWPKDIPKPPDYANPYKPIEFTVKLPDRKSLPCVVCGRLTDHRLADDLNLVGKKGEAVHQECAK